MSGSSSVRIGDARLSQLLRRPWLQRLCLTMCALAVVLATGLYYRKQWPSYEAFSRAVDASCMVPYCDFTLFYYKQARVIRQDANPVKKYFYSPTFALLLTPLAVLSKEQAQNAWAWFQAASLLLLIVASGLCLRGFSPALQPLLLALTLTSYPVLHNWKWGQANTTFVALVVLSFALLQRQLLAAAALALALVAACRYYPAVYALSFITRGRYRALIWFALACVLLLIAWPALAMGAEQALHFYRESRNAMAQANSTWVVTISSSQYLPSTVARLARAWHLGNVGTRGLWASCAGMLGLCNIALAWLAIRKRLELFGFSLIALSTPLLLPTSWMHYFVYLPLIQTFTLGVLLTLRRNLWLQLAALTLLWMPSVVLPSVFFYLRIGNTGQYARTGYLLFADLAQLLLVYLLLLTTARHGSKDPCRTAPWRTSTSQ
jgi:hypothetical protein